MTAYAAVDALLLDIDGTLVDSNYLHVDAWQRAFAEVGHPVDAWRIHRAIGMDSSRLLEELLGAEPGDVGDRAAERQAEIYRGLSPRLRPFPGARDLIGEAQRHRVRVALVTSAPEAELGILLDVLQLSAGEVVTTNADDVDEAKPEPGIVRVALDRVGVDAGRAVFVGDSVWDMMAAKNAGMRAIGVRSGGIGTSDLRDAGADLVVDSVADLLPWGAAWSRVHTA